MTSKKCTILKSLEQKRERKGRKKRIDKLEEEEREAGRAKKRVQKSSSTPALYSKKSRVVILSKNKQKFVTLPTVKK